eukprot:437168-Prorocentrum_minimum.AAC.1
MARAQRKGSLAEADAPRRSCSQWVRGDKTRTTRRLRLTGTNEIHAASEAESTRFQPRRGRLKHRQLSQLPSIQPAHPHGWDNGGGWRQATLAGLQAKRDEMLKKLGEAGSHQRRVAQAVKDKEATRKMMKF